MCECPDYDDGTRHTCEACVGDLETMREKLAASEAARREAERDLAASRSLQEGTAALLAAAERRVEEAEAKLADEERQRGEALTRICAEFNVTSSLQLASLAERDDETTIDLVIKLIRSSFSARERAERERDEARDNLKLVKWTPNDDRMMEMLVAEKERDEYGVRLARVEAALLSLAQVGEDEDGQPVLRISCGFRCQTPDTTVLPLVWAALAEIGGKR